MLLIPFAFATDTWTDPEVGVRFLHRTASGPEDIYVAEVDLCERGVSLRATKESERQDQADDFGAAVGAQVAVNGDFFSYDDYYPNGLAIGDGTVWNDDNTSEANLVFGLDHAWIAPEADDWSTPAWWMDDAVSGYPRVVVDGEVPSSFSRGDCDDLHPRTIAGLSFDRRTLWLVAVDGRSSASDGMTCDMLGELMLDLGAHTAVNLDGGGSTTLWFEAYGTVNTPSDGSERVVSNHMAVYADGSGAPEACDWWVAELVDDASILDAPSTTDVDGDGTPDLCARGGAGLDCHPAGAFARLTDLSDDAGFDDPANYATLRFGDIDGDRRADVCARRDEGYSCWPSVGTGFGTRVDLPDLDDASGWSAIQYYSTVRLADVTGDGRDDVCARGASGVRCWPSNGAGFDEAVVGPELSDARGWSDPAYYGTLRAGDLDGDGIMDLCARGGATMYCYRSDGAAWTPVDGPDWSDAEGWDDVKHWSTIRFVDVDGDRLDDLVGRGPDGVMVARSTGQGFATPTLGVALADSSGWYDHSNYATIRLGDLDADGDADLCARANAGYSCWLWDGASWATRVDGPLHSDDSGWADWRYYTTVRLADLDGDGAVELCDRAAAGVHCYDWDGSAWTSADGPAWTDALGWDARPHFTTLRLAGRRAREDDAPLDTASGDSGDSDGDDSGPPSAKVISRAEGCGCGGGAPALGLGLVAAAALGLRRRSPAPA